jgi:hypothetical protein
MISIIKIILLLFDSYQEPVIRINVHFHGVCNPLRLVVIKLFVVLNTIKHKNKILKITFSKIKKRVRPISVYFLDSIWISWRRKLIFILYIFIIPIRSSSSRLVTINHTHWIEISHLDSSINFNIFFENLSERCNKNTNHVIYAKRNHHNSFIGGKKTNYYNQLCIQ